jgi:hypothetical protein
MTFSLTSIKFKDPTNTLTIGEIDWERIREDPEANKTYNDAIKALLTYSLPYTDFCKCMKTAGLAAATTTMKRRVGWFENDKDHMQPLIEKKAELLHRSRNPNPQDDLETIQSNLKIASKEVKDRTEIAKSIWAKKLGEKVNHVNITPKQAWEAAYEIKDRVK